MADCKVRITLYDGTERELIISNATPAQVETKINDGLQQSKLVKASGRLYINPFTLSIVEIKQV